MGKSEYNYPEKIKVLIIGLGSIGQRHAAALLSLGINNLAALRTGKGQKLLDKSVENKTVMFDNELDAFDWTPTHMIISNPTSLHLDFIQKAISRKIKFFVEKPIADSFDDIQLDDEYSEVNGMVGYILRFNGLFKNIKRIISSNEYGRVITAQMHVGQYLPNWHPYEDYRQAYYSRKELGGGAIRTLSHEIDLMQFLFGNVKSVFARVERLSDLEINVDDTVNIIAEASLCRQINLHINFLDPKIVRKGLIYFSKGVLDYDYSTSTINFTSNSGNRSVIYSSNESFDKQYIAQMDSFLFDKEAKLGCSFCEGVKVLQIIKRCEQSNNEKREICLI